MTNAKDWTMDELTRGDFRIYEFPVTIACDGSAYTAFIEATATLTDHVTQTEGRR